MDGEQPDRQSGLLMNGLPEMIRYSLEACSHPAYDHPASSVYPDMRHSTDLPWREPDSRGNSTLGRSSRYPNRSFQRANPYTQSSEFGMENTDECGMADIAEAFYREMFEAPTYHTLQPHVPSHNPTDGNQVEVGLRKRKMSTCDAEEAEGEELSVPSKRNRLSEDSDENATTQSGNYEYTANSTEECYQEARPQNEEEWISEGNEEEWTNEGNEENDEEVSPMPMNDDEEVSSMPMNDDEEVSPMLMNDDEEVSPMDDE